MTNEMKPIHDKIYLAPHCSKPDCPAYKGFDFEEFGIVWSFDVPWEPCVDCGMEYIEYIKPKTSYSEEARLDMARKTLEEMGYILVIDEDPVETYLVFKYFGESGNVRAMQGPPELRTRSINRLERFVRGKWKEHLRIKEIREGKSPAAQIIRG